MALDIEKLQGWTKQGAEFYWTKDKKIEKWSDTGFDFYLREFLFHPTGLPGNAVSLIDMWMLKPNNGATIASVTAIPDEDRLIHVGSVKLEPQEYYLHCWYYYKFDRPRVVEYDISYLMFPDHKTARGNINEGKALTFVRNALVDPKKLPEGTEPTGPEKFSFVIIDDKTARHELTLEMKGEDYSFRKTTRAEIEALSETR